MGTRPALRRVKRPRATPISTLASRLRPTVKLGERLNQNVYVENKVGGGGILGHQFVLDQPPDGYTLLLRTTAPLVVVPAINRNAHFRLGDFSAIAAALRSPYMLVVNTQPDSPRTLAELTRKLAATPSSFSSSGTGTLTHLATEMYLQQAGVKATHVPYKGSGQSLADLAGGQVLFSIDSPIAAAPLLRGERLRALAVTSPQRLPGYPEVPTMAESGYPGLTLPSAPWVVCSARRACRPRSSSASIARWRWC